MFCRPIVNATVDDVLNPLVQLREPFELIQKLTGTKPDFIVPIEIGGLNSVLPLIAGAHNDLPVVDCDGMGRAFPQVRPPSLIAEKRQR